MPRHEKGTLVQVKEWALSKGCSFMMENQRIVERSGYLWFIEEWSSKDEYYSCRSLASGERDVTFYPEEIRGQHKKETISE